MTTIENLEQVLARAKNLQQQGILLSRQGEVKLRENLHNVFDQGLTLLGKGILMGRKATEAFVAETHRKADRLKRTEEVVAAGLEVNDDVEAANEPASDFIHASQGGPGKNMNSHGVGKKSNLKKMKNKKGRAPLTATARSH